VDAYLVVPRVRVVETDAYLVVPRVRVVEIDAYLADRGVEDD
jgi:hypothetical protein